MIMGDVMLALGDYRFSINSAAYKTLKRTSRYRWQQQQRAGRLPAQQYLGRDADTITLDGEIFPHFKGGLGQIESMRSVASTGRPQMLTDGLGNVWGRYVITSVTENQGDFMNNGASRHIEFSIELKEYGED